MTMKKAIYKALDGQDVQAQGASRREKKHWIDGILDCDMCFPDYDTLASASTSENDLETVDDKEKENSSDTAAADAAAINGMTVNIEGGPPGIQIVSWVIPQTDKYASVGGASQGNGKSRNNVSRSVASGAPAEPYIMYSKSPMTFNSISPTMPKEEAKYGDSSARSSSSWKQRFKKGKAPKAVQQQQQTIEKRQDTNTDLTRVTWRSMVTNKAPKLNADHGRDMAPAYDPETSIPSVFTPAPTSQPLSGKAINFGTGNRSPMNTQGHGYGGGGPVNPQHGQHYYPQHQSSYPYGNNPSSPYGHHSPHHHQQHPITPLQQQQYPPQQQYSPQQHYQQNYHPRIDPNQTSAAY